MGVAANQPAKMAAYEAHYNTEPADLYLFGWVNEDQEKVQLGVKLPGMLSFLIHGDSKNRSPGCENSSREDRPPVNVVFQSYHAMVAIGMA